MCACPDGWDLISEKICKSMRMHDYRFLMTFMILKRLLYMVDIATKSFHEITVDIIFGVYDI